MIGHGWFRLAIQIYNDEWKDEINLRMSLEFNWNTNFFHWMGKERRPYTHPYHSDDSLNCFF